MTPQADRVEEASNIIVVDNGLPQTKDTNISKTNPLSEQEEVKLEIPDRKEEEERQSLDKSNFDQYSPVKPFDDDESAINRKDTKSDLNLVMHKVDDEEGKEADEGAAEEEAAAVEEPTPGEEIE